MPAISSLAPVYHHGTRNRTGVAYRDYYAFTGSSLEERRVDVEDGTRRNLRQGYGTVSFLCENKKLSFSIMGSETLRSRSALEALCKAYFVHQERFGGSDVEHFQRSFHGASKPHLTHSRSAVQSKLWS